jgi:flagellar hook-associated protein 3 FlgL
MSFRVTDSSANARLVSQINAGQLRVYNAQEKIASGKRINRPSDDPVGAGAVIKLRMQQSTLGQFKRNTEVAHDALLAGDTALDSYENTLDRAKSVLTAGATSFATAESKQALVAELTNLRTHMLGLANNKLGDRYIFGGTRQDAPPYDSTGVAAATPTAAQQVLFSPDSIPQATGVVAENIFADSAGTVFAALDTVITALNGTGNEAADQAAVLTGLDRLSTFAGQARVARIQLGTTMAYAQDVISQLDERSLSLESSAIRVEGADFAEAAIELTQSQQGLDAILQTRAVTHRRTLLDILG